MGGLDGLVDGPSLGVGGEELGGKDGLVDGLVDGAHSSNALPGPTGGFSDMPEESIFFG